MSNQFKKAVIDDVSCRSIDETLQASLLDLFEYAMKTAATTLGRTGDAGVLHGRDQIVEQLTRLLSRPRVGALVVRDLELVPGSARRPTRRCRRLKADVHPESDCAGFAH